MAVGLFCVFLKIGRQARFWRAALRPQTSWMTRELYAVAVFYPALAWVLAGGGAMAQGLVALSAVAFLGCQAMILVRARGIPAWRAPLIPRMIAASGMAEGGGALLVLLALAGTVLPGALAVKLIVLVLVNTVLWWRYRSRASAEGIGPLARQAIGLLNRPVHLIGHGLPLLAIIAALIVPAASEGLMLVAGLALVAGGFLWKFGVIVQAGYQQGFALASLPQRGSGRHAAPVRLKAHVRP
jgi:phenylacetyl-CoA:acceptor oxidoreductase subunit 2